jgi:hypothetical protein
MLARTTMSSLLGTVEDDHRVLAGDLDAVLGDGLGHAVSSLVCGHFSRPSVGGLEPHALP